MALFLAKTGDEIGREKGRKNLVPNSVHTRPGHENCEKNRTKFKKITKTSLQHFLWPKPDEIGRKREKTFYSRIPFILDWGKKIPKKKIAKKFKKLKNVFLAFFLAKTG